MFIQTVIQHLLGKRKKEVKMAKTTTEQELSPMAQSIMQKLSEHEKKQASALKFPDDKEKLGNKSDS